MEDDRNLSESVYNVNATPTNMMIDREGRVIFTSVGFGPGKEKGLAAEIEILLGAS